MNKLSHKFGFLFVCDLFAKTLTNGGIYMYLFVLAQEELCKELNNH